MPDIFLIAPSDAEPAAFAATLATRLETLAASALLVPRAGHAEGAYKALVKAILPVAQAQNVAVLVEGDPGLVRMLRADGLHVGGGTADVEAAVAALKPEFIVGAAIDGSRDDAMEKGELGVDYVFFGPLSGRTDTPTRELAEWWAETMEVPGVLSDPELQGVAEAETACEFIALGEGLWEPDAVKFPLALAALPFLVGASVAASPQPDAGIDLRPEQLQLDNLRVEDLPLGSVPEPAEAAPDAVSISNQVFGPRIPTDEAFGAFQRGFFLTALELALPRAEKNDAAAQTLIAEIYAQGLGVAENLAQASGWYALASRNGDKLATFELAMLYQQGKGVPQNRKKAAELFRTSADLGCIPAKYNLGLLYIDGVYVPPDLAKAAALIKEAADAGMPEAQYDYGSMLVEGAGVVPDPRGGADYIGRAAEQGLVSAQIDYATMLYLGKGVPRDLEGAVRWYQRAADAGNPVAQNRFGKLLAVGEGIDLDLQQAAMWRALARRQGLSDPSLDRLLVSISPAELAAAEELARFWPSLPPKPGSTASLTPPSAPQVP